MNVGNLLQCYRFHNMTDKIYEYNVHNMTHFSFLISMSILRLKDSQIYFWPWKQKLQLS